MRTLLLLGLCVCACLADVHLKEEFDDSWEDRWIQSKHKDDFGKFVASSGKWYGDKKRDQGIKTSQDARFYALSTKFDKASNRGKPLVVQLTVKHEQNIDCGGGYVKVAKSDVDQGDFQGETPYQIMFGPDICGSSRKVHVILDHKGKNFQLKKNIACKDDDLTHLYTLIIQPDNTYEVQIDGSKVESGELEADFDFLPAKKIKDPDAKKPSDWVDSEMMDDPSDVKPEGYDDIPEHIADPNAKQPEDWDAEMDGEWEAPLIDNAEYKGAWKPKQIKNKDYKGAWIHPEIDNPEYAADDELYLFDDLGVAAFDLWQVKSGTIFDNLLITDDLEEAKSHAAETYEPLRDAEKQKKEEFEEEEKKRLEEEEKKRKEEESTKKSDEDDKEDKDEKDDDDDDAEAHDEL